VLAREEGRLHRRSKRPKPSASRSESARNVSRHARTRLNPSRPATNGDCAERHCENCKKMA
jgi:hypothetical protein